MQAPGHKRPVEIWVTARSRNGDSGGPATEFDIRHVVLYIRFYKLELYSPDVYVEVLTTNEQYVMLAIARGGRQSYALSIQDEIKTHGHALTLGVLYTVLNRLERRGLIRHRDGDPVPERGDRAKRYYSLTGAGAQQLRSALSVLDGLRGGAYLPQGV